MEPENDGLEDDVPFQLGDFLGSMLIFRGVPKGNESSETAIDFQKRS